MAADFGPDIVYGRQALIDVFGEPLPRQRLSIFTNMPVDPRKLFEGHPDGRSDLCSGETVGPGDVGFNIYLRDQSLDAIVPVAEVPVTSVTGVIGLLAFRALERQNKSSINWNPDKMRVAEVMERAMVVTGIHHSKGAAVTAMVLKFAETIPQGTISLAIKDSF